jgi:short-subunit dehydrogenase
LNPREKVVVVTGASSGIGLELSIQLCKKGSKVVLVSRSKERLEKISAEVPNSLAIQADMSKIFEIKRMIIQAKDHFGRIDVLINNAGQGYDAMVERIDSDTFHYLFDLNLLGPVIAMEQVIPIMRIQGGGSIANISSAVALMNLPNMSPYASLKRALSQLSLTAREELKKDNINVSVAYPYITLTNFEKNTIRDVPVPEIEQEPSGPFPPDSSTYTSQKIIEGIENGDAEIFTHDWLKKMAAGPPIS